MSIRGQQLGRIAVAAVGRGGGTRIRIRIHVRVRIVAFGKQTTAFRAIVVVARNAVVDLGFVVHFDCVCPF